MKPWFEKESNVIKFPAPKAKVVQMPNVQSYPDFLTGVKDLHARVARGEISQQSHDKLYQDLIHRFMKKESFETPWFLREKTFGSNDTAASRPKYVAAINDRLKKGLRFKLGKNADAGELIPNPGQTFSSYSDTITGKVNGKDVTLPITRLYKDPAITGNVKTVTGKAKRYWNLGYVSEGLFAIGLWLGLKFSKTVDPRQIALEAQKLKTNNQLVPGINQETKDKISLRINLGNANFEGLTDASTYQDPQILGQLKSIANYVNNSQDYRAIDDAITKNKKVDKVEVIADGMSDQKGSTVDVFIRYEDGTETEFKRSLKSGKVTQFGQGSLGGKINKKISGKPDFVDMPDDPRNVDSEKSKFDPSARSREDRWQYQEDFWDMWGIDVRGLSEKDIQKINKGEIGDDDEDIVGTTEQIFLDDPDLLSAYDFVYKEAATVLDAALRGDKKEKKFVQKMFQVAKSFAGAKITYLDAKGGYRVMDFNELDNFVDKVDLTAKFVRTKQSGAVKDRPAVEIYDKKKNEKLMSIELEIQDQKALNSINYGPLLKDLTTVEQYPKPKQK